MKRTWLTLVIVLLATCPGWAVQELRQSTQVDVRIGPFVDVGDGFTPETGVDVATADEAEALKHNGAATVDISGLGWAAVASCDGWYDLTLTTSTTDTLGQLTIVVQDDSLCLPVFHHFVVVHQDYWDAKYTATGPLVAQDIQDECEDALEGENLDHLMATATAAADMTTEIVDNSALSRILANGDTSAFDPSTDGLQLIRDRGDAAWTSGGGVTGTVGAVTSSSVFAVSTDFPAVAKTYREGMLISVTDNDDSKEYFGFIKNYSAARVVTLLAPLPITPEQTNDAVTIYPTAINPYVLRR